MCIQIENTDTNKPHNRDMSVVSNSVIVYFSNFFIKIVYKINCNIIQIIINLILLKLN